MNISGYQSLFDPAIFLYSLAAPAVSVHDGVCCAGSGALPVPSLQHQGENVRRP